MNLGVAGLMLLAGPIAWAQNGVLTGKVLNANQIPVGSAKVCLQRLNEKTVLTATTNAGGIYRFDVAEGSYALTIQGGSAARTVVIIKAQVTHQDLESSEAEFFDEPKFTVAGVTNNNYRGGHGSDTILRSSENLAKATESLGGINSTAAEYERAGRPLEALRELERAVDVDPSEVNFFNWGTELLSHRAFDASEEAFRRGLRFFPHSTNLMLGLASALYSSASYDEASNWFFQATDIDPNDAKPYEFLGKVQAGQISKSTEYVDRMARFATLQPNSASANYYYGTALWKARQSSEASSFLQRATAINPHLGPAWLQLGIILASEKSYQQAIVAYRKALATSPELEEAHYLLSEAYRLSGDRDLANQELVQYKKLAKLSSDNLERERQQIRQFVVALRQTNKH